MSRRPAFPLLPRRRKRSTSANAKYKRQLMASPPSGGLRCQACSYYNHDHPFGDLDVHHLKRRADGGKDDESNYVILCPRCHRIADRLSKADPRISRSRLISSIRSSCKCASDALSSTDNRSVPRCLEVPVSQPAASPPEITETFIPPSADDPTGSIRLDVAPEPETSADEVLSHSTADFIVVGIKEIKDQLLKIPVNAYMTAMTLVGSFEREGQPHMANLYREAAHQLRVEGYAPTFDGQPGPAVREYYANQAGSTRRR